MTKKHYEAIASDIADSYRALMYTSTNTEEIERAVDVITDKLSATLKKENPNFDAERFKMWAENEKDKWSDKQTL